MKSDTPSKSKLRLARENKGMSREMVVRQLEPPITVRTLQRMEAGETPLRKWRVEQLAAIYGVRVHTLMERKAA